jgi:hypothetical protein
MSLLDLLFGRSCDMCGRRGSDVIRYVREGMNLHSRCKRQLRAADRG